MTSTDQRIVIVGGGIAAVRTAQMLRNLGHTGQILLVSEEDVPPYDRPPLSKEFLAADVPAEPSALIPAEAADKLDIDLRLSTRAVGVDVSERALLVDANQPIPYDALVIATGTRARSLSHLRGVSGVHHLRTVEDARAIEAAIARRSALTIVGGGFIGLEIAAAARRRDCDVTVVEVADRPLAPVLGQTLATWLQRWHTERGVDFRCGVTVDAVGAHGKKLELTLSDGTSVRSGAVVVGVGVHRELDWLQGAGIDTHVGLVCDADGRTSAPGVFGAGDVACIHDASGSCRPVQHWSAAVESAQRVGSTVLGLTPKESARDDYFWSNQGSLRLMSVGHRTATSELEIVTGALADDKFVARWVEQDGRIAGVVGANSPKEFLRGRMAFRRDAAAMSAPGS